ncbi:dihydrolipoyl dehydrogenase [Haladaptatus pallidirubidus]|uniref:Dihydrolipoyl dehydrogenase n=2 Tax=Haladaptatus pallidirubidus TaxID=1008152 RepID=A0AAV3URK3_9EURY|nr:dihydrolipoyl dehydrogenase [Haladaptatus pallidirubidus]
MDTELLVVGGGPAGYSAAIRGAQCGLSATLVDDGNIGGTCLNTGCIPSKALLSATKIVAEAERSEDLGIYSEPYVDFAEMVAWKDEVVERLTSGVEQLCQTNDVTIVDGQAHFINDHTVRVDDEDIRFDQAIVATGSRPIELPGFAYDDAPILDAAQTLSLDHVPPRLLVVGAGYIGMEISTVFARLGARVTVIELLDSVLPQYDTELTNPVREGAAKLGVDFYFNESASTWMQRDESIVVTTETQNGKSTEHEVDAVLVAVGRIPVTDGLNLESIGVELSEKGFVETDREGKTSRDHVFAIGDVAGDPMLAHAGVHEGIVAAETITDKDPASRSAIPEVVFTDPEIATVGESPTAVRERGGNPIVGQFPFSASGRAMTADKTEGFVRLVGNEEGRIVGGQIVGSDASELIGEVTVAVENGVHLADLESTAHAHPTFSEAIMEAAAQAFSKAIHTPNR